MQVTNGTIDPIAPAPPLACNARLEGKILRKKSKLTERMKGIKNDCPCGCYCTIVQARMHRWRNSPITMSRPGFMLCPKDPARAISPGSSREPLLARVAGDIACRRLAEFPDRPNVVTMMMAVMHG
jgi:hypothetical protein